MNKQKYLENKGLTPKEAEAVALRIDGNTINGAARKLGISRVTLYARLNPACEKLGVKNSKGLRLWWTKESE